MVSYPMDTGGYTRIASSGKFLKVTSTTPEDPVINALITPYTDQLNVYRNTIIGQTTTPLDALQAFTQETNAANLQADSAVWQLADEGIDVDFYLSGAMTNKKVADAATITNPVTLTVDNMFTADAVRELAGYS